jgi:hypothetical protein
MRMATTGSFVFALSILAGFTCQAQAEERPGDRPITIIVLHRNLPMLQVEMRWEDAPSLHLKKTSRLPSAKKDTEKKGPMVANALQQSHTDDCMEDATKEMADDVGDCVHSGPLGVIALAD